MIHNIQILRAFAAVNVILFHIIGASSYYNKDTQIISILEGWGANGVDIFFIISGFVMLYIQDGKTQNSIDFFKNRIIRIVPTYWIFTAIVVVISYAIQTNNIDPHDIEKIFLSFLFLSGALTNLEPIVYVGWTIEWEMLFYSIFSLSLFFKRQNNQIFSTVVLLILSSLISQNLIALEFALGMLAAMIYKSGKLKDRNGLVIFLLGLTLLFLSISNTPESLKIDRFFIWGIPSFLIVLGALHTKEMKNKFLCYLGNASYSIYLVQVLSIPFFYKLTVLLPPLITNNDILAISCLFFTIALGCIFHSFIEKPLTNQIKLIAKF